MLFIYVFKIKQNIQHLAFWRGSPRGQNQICHKCFAVEYDPNDPLSWFWHLITKMSATCSLPPCLVTYFTQYNRLAEFQSRIFKNNTCILSGCFSYIYFWIHAKIQLTTNIPYMTLVEPLYHYSLFWKDLKDWISK